MSFWSTCKTNQCYSKTDEPTILCLPQNARRKKKKRKKKEKKRERRRRKRRETKRRFGNRRQFSGHGLASIRSNRLALARLRLHLVSPDRIAQRRPAIGVLTRSKGREGCFPRLLRSVGPVAAAHTRSSPHKGKMLPLGGLVTREKGHDASKDYVLFGRLLRLKGCFFGVLWLLVLKVLALWQFTLGVDSRPWVPCDNP